MVRSLQRGIVVPAALAALLAAAVPAVGAAGGGMLTAGDTGLKVISAPHASTVIAYDLVEPGTCAAGEDVEHDARVVSFGSKAGASGPALNQIVYDLGSEAKAEAFFADLRTSDQERADCGATQKASGFSLTKGPKGVGDERFTVTSKEKIAGSTRNVVSVQIRAGSFVTELVFLDWAKGPPPVAKVAKRAVARLG